MSFDVLRHHKPDHHKSVNQMTGEEVLLEFLFLISGFADVQEPRLGVHLGLSSLLEARKEQLRLSIIDAVNLARCM